MRRRVKRTRALAPALGLLAIALLFVAALTACTADTDESAAAIPDASPAETRVRETSVAAASGAGDASLGAEEMPPSDSAIAATEAEDASADEAAETREQARSVADIETLPVEEDSEPLPRLIDLGATKCIPCKKMAPILEELAETKKAYFEVDFFDVWENPGLAQEYGVRIIPTQIFYSAAGEELYRHIGFYSREQILDKWRALGIDVGE
jgi:thioredoxin 1